MMPTFTEVLPERKSSKASAINWTPAEDASSRLSGALTIHTAKATVKYAVTPFDTTRRGRGFTLVKVLEDTAERTELYHVFCGADAFAGDDCDCKGFTYSRTCKHVDACRSLILNRWL